tara:strand:- start:77 stop:340 length:264 start_codon:yes stop_codon:yes gene_type:complete
MGKHREEWKLRLPKEYEKLLKENFDSLVERASVRESIRTRLSFLEALEWQIPEAKKDKRTMTLDYLISQKEKNKKELDEIISRLKED